LIRGFRRYFVMAAASAIGLAVGVIPATSGVAATSSSGTTLANVTFLGTTGLAVGDGSAVDGTTNESIPNFVGHQPKNPSLNHVAADGVPQVAGSAIAAGQLNGFSGFNGINHRQQRGAGTGIYSNTQFSLEPPDQGLCVGNGFVLEAVNDALRVYSASSGLPLSSTTALNQFFAQKPAVVRSTPAVFGDFVSDPKCYFDPADQRWFVTALQIGLNPSTAAFVPPTHMLIAISKTSNPTGAYNLFSIDTTDDGSNGTPAHPNCPCFGDQPLIGADANGFYVSTNEFGLVNFPFNGAQIYAMSKFKLESGVTGTVVHIDAGPMLLPAGGLAFSVQPATAPSGSNETANGGTEFFMSDLDFTAGPALGIRANRLAVWALTHTSSLATASPSVGLTNVVISSGLYVQPPNAEQKSGELFLGDIFHNPLALVAANDDRLNQVVFAAGKLWAGVNTALQADNGPTRVGIGYFIVAPSDASGSLSASMVKQGYVAASQENLLFPSIGVTATGKGVITFSLVGPDVFPSTAYASIDAVNGVGDIHIAAAGQGPEDGFTGYDNPKGVLGNGDVARWGDYTAAVADGDSVWFATEYIAHPATDRTTRTVLANWATFVAHVTP
jgi:hypothetical protein